MAKSQCPQCRCMNHFTHKAEQKTKVDLVCSKCSWLYTVSIQAVVLDGQVHLPKSVVSTAILDVLKDKELSLDALTKKLNKDLTVSREKIQRTANWLADTSRLKKTRRYHEVFYKAVV